MGFLFGSAEKNYDISIPVGFDNESRWWKLNDSKTNFLLELSKDGADWEVGHIS